METKVAPGLSAVWPVSLLRPCIWIIWMVLEDVFDYACEAGGGGGELIRIIQEMFFYSTRLHVKLFKSGLWILDFGHQAVAKKRKRKRALSALCWLKKKSVRGLKTYCYWQGGEY